MTAGLLEDGLHPAIDRDHYDRIERVSFSTLKLMRYSPAHYHHNLVNPVKDTDAKKVGRVVHLAIFEPERFRNCVAKWDGGTRRGKDWDAFREKNEGRELLTEAEHDRCIAIQNAVRADKVAQALVARGRGEVTLLWTIVVGGAKIKCKGRIDFDALEAIVDAKTTKDAEPAAFGRQCHDLSYVAQAAWYVDGYSLATGVRKPYKIVAVENEAPHVVQVYRVPDELLDLGRETYLGWLDKLTYCRSQNYWPGYAEGELDLSLPPWAMPFEEDEQLTQGGTPL